MPDTDVHAIRTTELTTLDDLRTMTHDIEATVAATVAHLAELRRGGAALSEAYAAAPWGTAGIARAVDALTEALASVPTLDDLGDYCGVLNREISATSGLVEAVESIGAKGDVGAFAPN